MKIFQFVCFFTFVFLCGCSSTGDKRDSKITLMRIFLEASANNGADAKTVTVLRTQPMLVQIEPAPFLDERFVEKAAVVDWQGTFFIQIKFDRHGALLLDNVSSSNPGHRIAIQSQFEKELRWLAAPALNRRIADGALTFTPDATREEADRIVLGLNNLAEKLKKHKKFDQPASPSN